MMLLNIAMPANASIFMGALLQIAAFDAVPTDNMYIYMFDIDDTPISENFNALGYETLQFVYNTGSIGLVIFFFLPFSITVYLLRFLPFEVCEKYSERKSGKIFFGEFFAFFIESYLILAVCFCINLTNMKWAHDDDHKVRTFGVNLNIVLTYVFTVLLIGMPIVVAFTSTKYFEELTQDSKKKERYGKFIEELNTKRNGKMVILYPVFNQVRKLSLAFTVVFLQRNPYFSLFSVNFQILFMIILVGLTKPFAKKRDNAVDMFNEFTLLVINYHLMSLTDWVSDGDTREVIGWSMIAVTLFSIAVNLTILAMEQYSLLRHKYLQW